MKKSKLPMGIIHMNGWYYLNYSIGNYIIFLMSETLKDLFDKLVSRLFDYYQLSYIVGRKI